MPRRVAVCAHRGASGTHPENTLAAFRHAVALGCEMVEFDVWQTADGACVILHDATVDRTTDGAGPVAGLTLDELKRLDAGVKTGPGFVGEPIPSLDELLDILPASVELNIHIKDDPDSGAAVVERVCHEIRTRDRYGSAFIAGSAAVLDRARAVDHRVRRCLLSGQDDPLRYVQRAAAFGCYAIQPVGKITSSGLCVEAHAAGLRVHPFYADDEAEMRRQIACGVDGILTNHPERLIAVLRALGLR